MGTNKHWNHLQSPAVLKRAWHLARLDLKNDFAELPLTIEPFHISRDEFIAELQRLLQSQTIRAHPLISIDIPKGHLGTRPGSVLRFLDRWILFAAIFLLAPSLDHELPDGIYSFRLKKRAKNLRSKEWIFRDSSITELPFLKHKTIRARVDPFESWYEQYRDFTEISRRAFEVENYRYLAVSDIAAYFENIQIPILYDVLNERVGSEQKLINLICSFLESWTRQTDSGRRYHRGIPQGSAASSFLGNIFLLPLDDTFREFQNNYDIKYFRYMDDVRIFTKNYDVAREAIFRMEQQLRRLHLNVQTAKTKILDEKQGKEITKELIDQRFDEVNTLADTLKKKTGSGGGGIEMTSAEKASIKRKLTNIAKSPPSSLKETKISGAREALSGMTLRTFKRWITCHMYIGDHGYTGRLLTEIEKNSDSGVTSKLVATARRFPEKTSISSWAISYLKRPQIRRFGHQEAELLRALRYLKRLDDTTYIYAYSRLIDNNAHWYVRVQAALLVQRMRLNADDFDLLRKLMEMEEHIEVKRALAILLVQNQIRNYTTVNDLMFHPNWRIAALGRLVRSYKSDLRICRLFLDQMFKQEYHWKLCDHISMLYAISTSHEADIRLLLKERLKIPRHDHPITEIRPILQYLYDGLIVH